MYLHQLSRSKWLKKKQVRRGRGNATGTGNYSGRWLKGQKSRSGHSMRPFFEGWQTSIVQRLPKARGFTRYYKLVKDVVAINLSTLDADERISDTMEISKAVLKKLGYISSEKQYVKILGHGNYAKHLTFVDIDAFSASAQEKIANPWTEHALPKKAPKKEKKNSLSQSLSAPTWTSKKVSSQAETPKKTVKKTKILETSTDELPSEVKKTSPKSTKTTAKTTKTTTKKTTWTSTKKTTTKKTTKKTSE